jgi:hypothetical protein
MFDLFTILYEGNYKSFFDEKKWFWVFNNKNLNSKILVINNLDSLDDLNNKIEDFKRKFEFSVVYVTKNKFIDFGVDYDAFRTSSIYSSPYFTMIERCDSEFLFCVNEDCMNNLYISEEYVENSIKTLISNENCFFTTVSWSDVENTGLHEMLNCNLDLHETEFFYPSNGFSDQLFFCNIEKIKLINFNSKSHPYLGPKYCENMCFEKKVMDFFKTYGKYRMIYKGKDYYIHNK